MGKREPGMTTVSSMAARNRLDTHYEREKRLAARIMNAPAGERAEVSLGAYDELFSTITWHDGHHAGAEREAKLREIYAPYLRRVGPGDEVLEVGCGLGEQARWFAERCRRYTGIDISEEVLTLRDTLPENVDLRIVDAVNLHPFDDDSFDVVFSSQLVEHLHPEDVPVHMEEMARVLRPGGRYMLETPNRVTGPHDVSRAFDDVATCFHLKEWTNGEILQVMREAGFRRFRSPLFRQAAYDRNPRLAGLAEFPTDWKRPVESLVGRLPAKRRQRLGTALRLRITLEAWV